ncbi:MAG: type I-F CRISPR-associated endoribonuclease Cas6/Csy4 [Methyloprofundus sp.]|nr:type I-F CRISPR-associated endoribonuclease Cas6/Csy4 [Methyloprofundus sp.]MDT8426428.1 type I-F CRISPR-associated endoribonuclease Cas6/Csy4 [Methyloprofundus sp.]
MNYFIDIKIKPDAEMRENVLLNKVISKLHKALFSLKSTEIGVSFPNYKVLLGNVIRLHGAEARLSELQNMHWLGGLSGYCQVAPIQTVPDNVAYRNISRIQSNMTEAKLRRLLARGSISTEEIKKYKAKMFTLGLDNPYLELESTSTGHKHRRYLNFSEETVLPVTGKFDFFGLSKTATIPWF